MSWKADSCAVMNVMIRLFCCLLSGWEYTVDISIGSYVAVEKTYHMSRRRRWVRSRSLMKSTHKEEKVQKYL